MGNSTPQVSFASGEISPRLYGRIDFQGYQNGLRTCRNFVVLKQGGVQNRAGTRFISEVNDSTKLARLVPFQFSTDQSYVLELGNQTMRVFKNGAVMQRPSATNVTGVTPAILAAHRPPIAYAGLTVVGHGLSGGESITVSGVQTGIDGDWIAIYIDQDHIQLGSASLGGSLAHGCGVTTITWVSGGTMTVGDASAGSALVVPTPWTSADLPLLKFTQSADVMTIVHPSYPPQQVKRYGDNRWTVQAFQAVNGPFLDLNTDQTKTMYVSAVSGSVTITANFAAFTADMVGLLIRIDQAPDDWTPVWEVAKAISTNEVVKYGASFYQAINAGTTGTLAPTHLEGSARDGIGGVVWQYIHSGFGTALITALTDAQHVTATVQSRMPDSLVSGSTFAVTQLEGDNSGLVRFWCPTHVFSAGDVVSMTGGADVNMAGTYSIQATGTDGTDTYYLVANADVATQIFGSIVAVSDVFVQLGTTNHSYKWAMQAWGSSQSFPAATAYYEQRQVFGGTPGQPQAMQFSTVTGYTDFGQGVPVLDDDAISATVFSNQVCQIKHFLELSSLIVLTSGGVFRCMGGSDGGGVLTPATIQVKPQSANAVSDVAPLRVDHYGLFIQEKGSQVRSLAYSFAEDSFIGQDMTVVSDHLFKGHTIIGWAYQETPNSNVWAVRDDGLLIGLTFSPEQQVTAWHRHDTAGLFESVCCITENNEDVVYFIVNRTINGAQHRYIERMDTRAWTELVDAFFVDCGLSYDGRNASSTTMTISGGTLWDNTETLTVTASSAGWAESGGHALHAISPDTGMFAATNVGDQIVFSASDADGNPVDYRLTITGCTSATVVNGIVNRPLPTAYQNAARTDWALAVRGVSGLDHLDGQTVSVLADGYVQSQKAVAGGAITLDCQAAVIHVGLPITADLETLEIGQAQIRDKKQTINRLSLIVDESACIQAGADANHLMVQKPPYPLSYDQTTQLQSELTTVAIPATWSKASRVFVRQDQPLPLSILAVIPEVTAGGS